MRRVVPAEGALLVAGSSGAERVPPRREGGFTGWHQPLHVRDRGAARQAIRAQVEAGADVVVAPAYLTHRRALSPYGETRRAAEWTRAAVEVAREAVQEAMEVAEGSASSRGVLIAGPMSPLLPGRFEPALDPGVLAEEDRERADLLVEAGVDLLLPELMPSLAEARSAAGAAVATGVRVWLGLRVAASGVHLPSGDALEAAWSEVAESGLDALLLTATGPLEGLSDVLAEVARFAEVPLGVWLAGWREPGGSEPARPEAVAADAASGEHEPLADAHPESLATIARHAIDAGARVLGLASGASPERLQELRVTVDAQTAAAQARRTAEERRWLDAVREAADRAPGGRALWLGAPPTTLPVGFDWTATSPHSVVALPERAFRLVVIDGPGDTSLDGVLRAVDVGGYLLVRSLQPIGAVPEALDQLSTEATLGGTITMLRRPS